MMKWVHQQASQPFELENLPHLSVEDKQRYKDQVREREVALDKKREEEAAAMRAEERAQAELKRKKRKLQKQRETGAATDLAEEETVSAPEPATGTTKAGSESVKPGKGGRLSALLDDHDEF
jgi:septal ring factor EnvC (AmiA/AmiB activator)